MSPKQVIKTSNAPDPVGPYNQAIKAGNFIYCSGQIAIDPAINEKSKHANTTGILFTRPKLTNKASSNFVLF